jgi:hypothetical protein
MRTLLLAGIVCLALPAGAADGPPGPGAGWRAVYERLSAGCAAMARDLDSAHAALLERAGDDEEVAARLLPEPVALRPPGYGVLPGIVEEAPPSAVKPKQKLFSLELLEREFPAEFRNATILARYAGDPARPLAAQADELERLQIRMRNLEDHLGYHAYWQEAVVEFPEFFEARNLVVARVRGLEGAGDEGSWREILSELAPFTKSEGLRIEERPDGSRVLPVTVTTDIGDEGFLAAFREGVESAFVESEAALRLRFSIELTLLRLTPDELYPEGPPETGSSIDLEAHLALFPEGARVLTTGEESTHAWPGRNIVLGPADVSRRTLAHEFAHLLGFRDAYLRGFDAASDERFGVVLVEWTGLQDDLMGDSKGGRVTPRMIRTLLRVYRPR